MGNPKTKTVGQGLGLNERRAFMRLPLEERRRRMAEQAAQIVELYEQRREVIKRDKWQGGDIVECS
jgi:hypothetical protein